MSFENQIMKAISEQYGAGFKMLEDIIVTCPVGLWYDSTSAKASINQVVYHTLYGADKHLLRNEAEKYSFKGKYGEISELIHDSDKAYTKDQLTEYLKEIKEKADKRFQDLTIYELNEASLFFWHGSSVLSSLLYGLRHIMLHIGALHVRVNNEGKIPLRWVCKYPEEEGAELTYKAFFYQQNGNSAKAEKIFMELIADSDNPLFYYNLACFYSVQKKSGKSIEYLKKCLKFDNTNRFKSLAKTDKDFANLRELQEFDQLINHCI